MNLTIWDGIYLGIGFFMIRIITWPFFAVLGVLLTKYIKNEIKIDL